jgi:hypothetical protein
MVFVGIDVRSSTGKEQEYTCPSLAAQENDKN